MSMKLDKIIREQNVLILLYLALNGISSVGPHMVRSGSKH